MTIFKFSSALFQRARDGRDGHFPAARTEQIAEKVIYFVIPGEVRNLSLVLTQEKRDSSARSAPRNDKNMSFSSIC
jgi:hypothetical protein